MDFWALLLWLCNVLKFQQLYNSDKILQIIISFLVVISFCTILILSFYIYLCSINMFYVHVFRRKIYDEYNDEEVELTKRETRLIRRLLKGKAPHAEFDPYAVCNSLSFHGHWFFYCCHLLIGSYYFNRNSSQKDFLGNHFLLRLFFISVDGSL